MTTTMPLVVWAGDLPTATRDRYIHAKRPRLTPHQRELLDRIGLHSGTGDCWVYERAVGSHWGCWKLVAKGYLEVATVVGPRGGKHYYYRPI
jgi:hypothetical protein